ncbi:MAG TPA: ATP-dependent helicase [Candidatus Limnocylindrales bacterium]|jgi:superfamily I DNA/RNA helicase
MHEQPHNIAPGIDRPVTVPARSSDAPSDAVAERLARLAADQRAAATAPPGPVLCVAPAGSGKTTTLVARVAWLVDSGEDPATVCVVAFNKRAAEELTARLDAALAPLGLPVGSVRVRTFHALGREMLAGAGVSVEPLVDRDMLLRELFPVAGAADRGRLDLAFSRLKLDLRVTADDVARDPAPGPVASAFVAYERSIAELGGVDFDDLVVRSLAMLQADPRRLAAWRRRCTNLLVDEAQDLDRTQLELALLLAEPANNVFLVGDDDQSIYGWRLADVRRVLGLAGSLPGLRRVDLETNYRCPRPVVERAVRLVEHNRERFVKRILSGPAAAGRLVLAPDSSDDLVRVTRAMRSWPADDTTRAVLARTNRELLVAMIAAVELGLPFRAPDLALPIEDERIDGLLERASGPALLALGALRRELHAEALAVAADAPPPDSADGPTPADLVTAMLGWAAVRPSIADLRVAIDDRRRDLARLRRDDASLTLATAHGTKGLEWDHVLVLADGFPGRRSISDATEPERALEEERRLAYVAWTRARRSLTLLYDPQAPSRFLLEAFSPAELGLSVADAA